MGSVRAISRRCTKTTAFFDFRAERICTRFKMCQIHPTVPGLARLGRGRSKTVWETWHFWLQSLQLGTMSCSIYTERNTEWSGPEIVHTRASIVRRSDGCRHSQTICHLTSTHVTRRTWNRHWMEAISAPLPPCMRCTTPLS